MQSLTAPTTTVAPPAVALRVLSDERLARLAAAGSQAAFAAIFERHHTALSRYCHSILGNTHDAADALQNTMLKALRALPGETRQIKLKPWLYRIAHNESISLLRARRPDANLELAAHVGDPAADAIVASRERLRDLTADLQELTEQQRGALLMRELGGLAFSDVAGALAVSGAAAKQSVYEARCALGAMQEGREMDCDVVRRTLSDGDRRMLRAMKMRGHLRACAGCRDFQTALRQRPAQLAAIAPPLPMAMLAAILQGLFGSGGGGGVGGAGGLMAGLGATAKSGGAFSLGAKVATAAAVTASVAGGVAYVAPSGPQPRSPSALTRDGAGHAVAVATARERAKAAVLLASESARATAATATRDLAVTANTTLEVAARQPERADSAPSSSPSGSTPPSGPSGAPSQPAAVPEQAPAAGSTATGARPDIATQRPPQSTTSAPAAAYYPAAGAPVPTTAPVPVAETAPGTYAAPGVDQPVFTAPASSGSYSGATYVPPPR